MQVSPMWGQHADWMLWPVTVLQSKRAIKFLVIEILTVLLDTHLHQMGLQRTSKERIGTCYASHNFIKHHEIHFHLYDCQQTPHSEKCLDKYGPVT